MCPGDRRGTGLVGGIAHRGRPFVTQEEVGDLLALDPTLGAGGGSDHRVAAGLLLSGDRPVTQACQDPGERGGEWV